MELSLPTARPEGGFTTSQPVCRSVVRRVSPGITVLFHLALERCVYSLSAWKTVGDAPADQPSYNLICGSSLEEDSSCFLPHSMTLDPSLKLSECTSLFLDIPQGLPRLWEAAHSTKEVKQNDDRPNVSKGKPLQALNIKGIPTTLPLYFLEQAQLALKESAISLSGEVLSVYPRLRGGMVNENSDIPKQEDEDKSSGKMPPSPLFSLRQEAQYRWKRLCNEDLPYRIPTRGTRFLQSQGELPTFDLWGSIKIFLESDKFFFLLQGDSGSGKTTFAIWLEHYLLIEGAQLDQGQMQQKFEWLPIYIEFNAIDLVDDFLFAHLSQFKLTDRALPYLFILDGYDEVSLNERLWDFIHFDKWPNAKVLVTCRTHFLQGDYFTKFVPASSILEEAYVAPLSQQAVSDYLQHTISQPGHPAGEDEAQENEPCEKNSVDNAQALEELLVQYPELAELATVPYLLRQLVDIRSQLVEFQVTNAKVERSLGEAKLISSNVNKGGSDTHSASRTKGRSARAHLYGLFTKRHFERAQARLHLSNIDLGANPIESFRNFSEGLAFEMVKRGVCSIDKDVDPTLKEMYFAQNPESEHIRQGSPICKVGSTTSTEAGIRYAFIHKSLLEYFAACHLYEELQRLKEAVATGNFFNENYLILLDSDFNARLLSQEHSIIRFLADKLIEAKVNGSEIISEETQEIRQAEGLQPTPLSNEELLFLIIQASKDRSELAPAASTAITLLNAARVPFSERDFSGVQIPYANLGRAVLDSTNLQRANLERAVLDQAFLKKTQFQQANLTECHFGEFAWLQHENAVHNVLFSSDGKMIATAGDEGVARVWKADSGTLLREFNGHAGYVISVHLSFDGKFLATASRDKTARLWEVETGALLKILEGHTACVNSVAFSPDGKVVATASDDKTARLWKAKTGTLLTVLEGHTSNVSSVAFSPNGKVLATASHDHTVRLWSIGLGTLLTALEGHTDWVSRVAFSPDGSTLASASRDRTVRLWNADMGILLIALKGHTAWVSSAVFSPNGKCVAAAGCDKTARLWDAETGTLLSTIEGHTSYVQDVAFNPQGKLLVTASGDGTVRLWDVTADTALLKLDGHTRDVTSVTFSLDGKFVATASIDMTACVWEAETGLAFSVLEGHTLLVNSVTFNPNGKVLATASDDKTACLWNLEGIRLATLKGHKGWVKDVAFNPKGTVLATASHDETICLWDVATTTHLTTLQGHTDCVNSVAFSPDGKLIATASHDETACLWDAMGESLLTALDGHTSYISSLAFSPNGKLIATASADKTAHLRNVKTGALLTTFKGHTRGVTSVAFSPNGTVIATASYDKTVRLWEAGQGNLLTTLKGHTNTVTSVAFSPDGKQLATGSSDGSVKVWSLQGLSAFEPALWWTAPSRLYCKGVQVEGVIGLSNRNASLINQRK